MSNNLSNLFGRKDLDSNAFEQMVKAAAEDGAPDNKELRKIAQDFLVGDAITHGTASFYDFLKEENRGKKVFTCNGSACLLANTQDSLKTDLENHFDANEIGEMCCLGRCHENNAFSYNGRNYSGDDIKHIEAIKAKKDLPPQDDYSVESNMEKPILTAAFPGVDDYYSCLKDILKRDPISVLEEIKISNVRGRGGAGFPMGFKLDSCRQVDSDQKYIVCNADEGDPGAYSDRYLLERQPHLVLFGMMISGFVSGADTGILYIRAEYPESIDIVEAAINELSEKGIIGENIFGTGFNYRFKIIKAAGAYICGEETALLNSIEGQRPVVRIRPPYPTVEGLFGKPTVVNNVETFANLHFIVNNGGEAYAAIGTEKSKGPKLVCLDSFFNNPGVFEVPMGTALNEIINDLGKGFKTDVKALHIGGPLGGIVPASKFDDLTLDFESFMENGFLLGHASAVSIPKDAPLIDYLKHLFEFTAHESCGKCFPCRLGATRGQELIEKSMTEDYKIDKTLFDDLLETMEIGSLCALGGGLPLGIKNALTYFQDELKSHFTIA